MTEESKAPPDGGTATATVALITQLSRLGPEIVRGLEGVKALGDTEKGLVAASNALQTASDTRVWAAAGSTLFHLPAAAAADMVNTSLRAARRGLGAELAAVNKKRRELSRLPRDVVVAAQLDHLLPTAGDGLDAAAVAVAAMSSSSGESSGTDDDAG